MANLETESSPLHARADRQRVVNYANKSLKRQIYSQAGIPHVISGCVYGTVKMGGQKSIGVATRAHAASGRLIY